MDNEKIIKLEKRVALLHERNESLLARINMLQSCVCTICGKDHTGIKGIVGSMVYLCFICKKHILATVNGIGHIEITLNNGDKLSGKIIPNEV